MVWATCVLLLLTTPSTLVRYGNVYVDRNDVVTQIKPNASFTPVACGTGMYEAVPAGVGTRAVCLPVATCRPGVEVRTRHPTPTTDTVCRPVATCRSYEHVSAIATATSDTQCRHVMLTCPSGFRVNKSASADATRSAPIVNGTQCVECDSGAAAGSGVHTSEVCTPLACAVDQYAANHSCHRCTNCAIVNLPCTPTSDAQCVKPGGDPDTQLCPPGEFRDENHVVAICTKFTDCPFSVVLVAPTPTTDRRCSNVNSVEPVLATICGVFIALLFVSLYMMAMYTHE